MPLSGNAVQYQFLGVRNLTGFAEKNENKNLFKKVNDDNKNYLHSSSRSDILHHEVKCIGYSVIEIPGFLERDSLCTRKKHKAG